MRPPAEPPRTTAAPSDGAILFVLWLVIFCLASQMMIVAPILPQVAREIAVAEAALGSLITSYAGAVALFALIAGPISDAVGRQRILLLGTAGMTVALLLHGFAWDFFSLLGARAVAGIAGGVLAGAAVAYVGDYFPAGRSGWANGWVMSGLAAGQVLGIPIGTILSGWLGFRAPFLLFAVAMGLTTVLVLVVLPRVPPVTEERPSLRAALAGYAGLLRRRDTGSAIFAFGLIFFGISLYVAYLPRWLESSHAATSAQIALLFFLGGVANALAGPRSGALSDTYGRKRIVVATSLAVAVAMLLAAFAASSLRIVSIIFVVVMGLLASRASPFQAMLTEMVPAGRRGAFMSLNMAVGQVGFGIGGAVAGPLYVARGYEGSVLAAAGAAFLLVPLAHRFLPSQFDGVKETEAPPGWIVTDRPGDCDALCGPVRGCAGEGELAANGVTHVEAHSFSQSTTA